MRRLFSYNGTLSKRHTYHQLVSGRRSTTLDIREHFFRRTEETYKCVCCQKQKSEKQVFFEIKQWAFFRTLTFSKKTRATLLFR